MFKKVFLIFLMAISSFAGCSSTPILNPGDSYKPTPYNPIVAGNFPSSSALSQITNTSSIVSQQNLGLWVNGTGKTTATPDVAILTLGVESQRKNVKQAQSDVANSMNSVMQVLNNYGVADKDIQTSGYNIQQVIIQQAVVYEVPMEQLPSSVLEGAVSSSDVFYSKLKIENSVGEKEIIEYKVSNTINVKIRNIGKTGSIVDDVVSSGGDLIRINGISFSVDDPTPYYKIAREKAVLYTMEKAKQISQLSGSQLGRMIYASESNSYYVSPVSNYARADMSMGMGSSAPTSISSGELEFQVSVEIVYELK